MEGWKVGKVDEKKVEREKAREKEQQSRRGPYDGYGTVFYPFSSERQFNRYEEGGRLILGGDYDFTRDQYDVDTGIILRRRRLRPKQPEGGIHYYYIQV